MPIPIEQRKDLFELSSDLNLLISYRKALLDKNPRLWICIHHNKETNNYGLEVNNSNSSQCSSEEVDEIRDVLRMCRLQSVPVIKKPRKKKDVS